MLRTARLYPNCYDLSVGVMRAVDVRAKLLSGFLLGRAKVEPLKGWLTIDDTRRRLSAEALDVLLHLADQPGVALSREELVQAVWGRGGGSEESLQLAVGELLLALDENPEHPEFIETLPGQGCSPEAALGCLQGCTAPVTG